MVHQVIIQAGKLTAIEKELDEALDKKLPIEQILSIIKKRREVKL